MEIISLSRHYFLSNNENVAKLQRGKKIMKSEEVPYMGLLYESVSFALLLSDDIFYGKCKTCMDCDINT